MFQIPPPSRAIILGKGPSLDRYDPLKCLSPLVVGINRAAAAHHCAYVFYLHEWAASIPFREPTIPIVPERFSHHHRGNIVFYRIVSDQSIPGKCQIQERFLIDPSAVAVWVLGAWGVLELLMIGFESITHGLSQRIKEAVESYNIKIRWFHKGQYFE